MPLKCLWARRRGTLYRVSCVSFLLSKEVSAMEPSPIKPVASGSYSISLLISQRDAHASDN